MNTLVVVGIAMATAGQIVRQVLSAALFGAFLALAAIGLRLSTLATRGAVSAPTDPRNWTARS